MEGTKKHDLGSAAKLGGQFHLMMGWDDRIISPLCLGPKLQETYKACAPIHKETPTSSHPHIEISAFLDLFPY